MRVVLTSLDGSCGVLNGVAGLPTQVTHDNYRALAAARLDMLLDVEAKPWRLVKTVSGVRIHELRDVCGSRGGGGGGGELEAEVLLRGTARLRAECEAVADVLWDYSRRVMWDIGCWECKCVHRFDSHHRLLEMTRRFGEDRGPGSGDDRGERGAGGGGQAGGDARRDGAAREGEGWSGIGLLMSRRLLPSSDGVESGASAAVPSCASDPVAREGATEEGGRRVRDVVVLLQSALYDAEVLGGHAEEEKMEGGSECAVVARQGTGTWLNYEAFFLTNCRGPLAPMDEDTSPQSGRTDQACSDAKKGRGSAAGGTVGGTDMTVYLSVDRAGYEMAMSMLSSLANLDALA
jgi:hypothetical protein